MKNVWEEWMCEDCIFRDACRNDEPFPIEMAPCYSSRTGIPRSLCRMRRGQTDLSGRIVDDIELESPDALEEMKDELRRLMSEKDDIEGKVIDAREWRDSQIEDAHTEFHHRTEGMDEELSGIDEAIKSLEARLEKCQVQVVV